jgi:hypothetical protein
MKKSSHLFQKVLVLIFLLYAQSVDAQESFICIPNHSTGYILKNTGNWEPTQFSVKEKKYILTKHKDKWYWNEFGKSDYISQNECAEFNERGFMDCKHFEDDILFNRNTLRFQAVHPYGYVLADKEVEKEHPITPFYEIGTCSSL